MARYERAFSFIFASLISLTLVADETAHPTIEAVRTNAPPIIDGHIDPEEWKSAGTIDSFTQVFPSEGKAASEKTVVRVMYDSERLYIGVQCFDSEPQRINASQMQKEGDTSPDDLFEIAIDPFGDAQNGYYFALTAAGGKSDGLIDSSSVNQLNTDWDTIWVGKTEVNKEGWSAEFAIPFKSVSFQGNAANWKINFERIIRRKQETVRWSALTRSEQFYDFNQAGELKGLERIHQGMGLIVTPYGDSILNLADGTMALRLGTDVSYKLTPSTTALFTLNTDFAEAEVDQQLVNLSPYPLFYPEKRRFFLQDMSVFSFGGIRQSPLPFYSRRIGITDNGRKPIFVGFKVTGREGPINFGMLDAQMYADPDLGQKNLFVGRAFANVLKESTAGVIVTHGDPSTTGDNTLIGADFNFRDSQVFGSHVIIGNAWGMGSFSTLGPTNANVSSGVQANDTAFGASVNYPNDDWQFLLFGARYGENFRPALGFISRPGTYELDGSALYRFRSDGFLRRIDVKAASSNYLYLNGGLQGSYNNLPIIEFEDEYGDVLDLVYGLKFDSLTAPFPIAPTTTVAPGSYLYHLFQISTGGSNNRELSWYASFVTGSFYSGFIYDASVELDWRPSKHLLLVAGYENIIGKMPEGDFVIRILYAKANIIFTPSLSWNTWFQYDNVSKNAGIFSRIRYEITPGQELFFVLNENMKLTDSFQLLSASGTLDFKAVLNLMF